MVLGIEIFLWCSLIEVPQDNKTATSSILDRVLQREVLKRECLFTAVLSFITIISHIFNLYDYDNTIMYQN